MAPTILWFLVETDQHLRELLFVWAWFTPSVFLDSNILCRKMKLAWTIYHKIASFLPLDRFEVLKQVREKVNKDIPVVLLTALGETEKVVQCLKLGADDYIVKPFEPSELVARIESVVKIIAESILQYVAKKIMVNPKEYNRNSQREAAKYEQLEEERFVKNRMVLLV